MRGLRGAGVVCNFITEGGVVKVGLEHVGSEGELRLGKRGGGEGEKGPGGALVGQEQRGKLLHALFYR
jgi:hypothetical protein